MSQPNAYQSALESFRTQLLQHYQRIATEKHLEIRAESLSVFQLEGLWIAGIEVNVPKDAAETGKRNPFLLFSVQHSETKWVAPGDYCAMVELGGDHGPKSGIETLEGELGKGFGIQLSPSPYADQPKHQVELSSLMKVSMGEKGNRFIMNGILGVSGQAWQFGILVG